MSGRPVDDDLIEQVADEAEAGYDPDEIVSRRGKRGRPRLGAAPSTVESVRLDPDLKARLLPAPMMKASPSPTSSAKRFGTTSKRADGRCTIRPGKRISTRPVTAGASALSGSGERSVDRPGHGRGRSYCRPQPVSVGQRLAPATNVETM